MAGELTGVEALLARLRAQSAQVQAVTPFAVTQAALWVEAAAKRLLSLSSHREGTPTPAPPGTPPSIVSGDLRRSIGVRDPAQRGQYQYSITVGPSIVYGRIQELGGIAGHGATLPARPYMAPAWKALEGRIAELFAKDWRDALD